VNDLTKSGRTECVLNVMLRNLLATKSLDHAVYGHVVRPTKRAQEWLMVE